MSDEHIDSRAKALRIRDRHLIIDMHCHTFAPKAEKVVSNLPKKLSERDLLIDNLGHDSVEFNESMMQDLSPKLLDIETRLAHMDRTGVDIQAVSPSPTQYYYWADEDVGRQLVVAQNENIAEICESNSDRFVGMGAVALQFPELAATQLEECVKKYGFRGVEISSIVNGKEIAHRDFWPFWAKAEELGVVVFIHPLGTTLGQRVNQYYLANTIGQPLEISLALSHLILGGVLDKFSGLKILAAHGGGYLGSCWGRLDHGWEVRPESHVCDKRPSEYAQQIFFDSVVHSPAELARLISQVGATNIVTGTDYPFDMGIESPADLLNAVENLTDDGRMRIRALNAEHLLDLSS